MMVTGSLPPLMLEINGKKKYIGTSKTEPNLCDSLTPSQGVRYGTAANSKTSTINPQAKNTCANGVAVRRMGEMEAMRRRQ